MNKLAFFVFTALLLAIAPADANTFILTITADSHLDDHTDREFYQRTLKRAAAAKPAFHIDLGDTFMSEKHANRAAAAQQYLDQRRYFDLLGVPVHLVIGNHDEQSCRVIAGDAPPLLSRAAAPDGRNYYAWQHGSALFVVLDPFWFTPRARRNDDNWFRTLGAEQYEWLKQTLETSNAKFKFVFIHHLVGGADRQGRGGVEVAPFYEWGGKNADGTDGFAQHRPGWVGPIHQLLLQHHVAAVFHGHDHLYAKQNLDGFVYQEVPPPGDPNGSTRSAAEYGYTNGVILGSSGHLRMTVSPETALVEYVSARGASAAVRDRKAGTVAHSYMVRGTGDPPKGERKP